MKRLVRLLGLSAIGFIMMGNTVFADIAPEKEILQLTEESNIGIIVVGIVLVIAAILLIVMIRRKRM